MVKFMNIEVLAGHGMGMGVTHYCHFQHAIRHVLTGRGSVDLNFDDFSLDYFRFLLDSYADGLAKGLAKRNFEAKIESNRSQRASLERTNKFRCHTCVSASVLFISSENISLPAIAVKGMSWPSAWAIPMAMAVLPVPG